MKKAEWIIIIRKNWNKNFEYQIVHSIWLRFFRPYVPMNILSGWFLSVSLFVCVFFLYVFAFVSPCVSALSLRFFNRTNVPKIFLGTRSSSKCLFVSLSLFVYFSVCLFYWRIFVCLSLCFFVYLYYVFCLSLCLFAYLFCAYFLSEDSSVRIFVCLSVCLPLCLFYSFWSENKLLLEPEWWHDQIS
jgi:hypothetical protein